MISHFDFSHIVQEFDEFYSRIADSQGQSVFLGEERTPFREVQKKKTLEERIDNIRRVTNQASEARYLATQDPEVILANLIMQVLEETEGQDGMSDGRTILDDILMGPRKLEEVLPGFEFYDNNPYRAKAEKRLEKIRRRNFK